MITNFFRIIFAVSAIIFLCGAKKVSSSTSEVSAKMENFPESIRGNEIARAKASYYIKMEKKILAAIKNSGLNISSNAVKAANNNDLQRNLYYSVVVKKVPQHESLSQMLPEARKVTVSDEEVREYYNKNPHEFSAAQERRVSHILLKNSAQVKQIENELKNGGDFAVIAKEKSLDPSRKNGGNLGWVRKGDLIQPVDNAVFSANKDEAKTVKSSFGYHTVKVVDIRLSSGVDYEDAKEQIREQLVNEKRHHSLQDFLKKNHKKQASPASKAK